jgi:predicted XRE-type DNA-binding protein
MSDDLELVRGSDSPFEDMGLPEADTKLIKADPAAEIIAILRERRLTGAAAAKLAGVQTADLSRIRNADLSRYTIDRLVTILNRLTGMSRCASRSGPCRRQSIPRRSFPETLWTRVFQGGTF